MTEIEPAEIEIRRGVIRYCAVDNHNHKKGKSYDIIYKGKTPGELSEYLRQKGVW